MSIRERHLAVPSLLWIAQVRCSPFRDADPPQHDGRAGPPLSPRLSPRNLAHLLGFSVGYSATVWVKHGSSNDLPCFHIVSVCLDGNQPAVLF